MMTIEGAISELVNLLNADDIPIYYKGGIKKVIETIDDYIDGKDDYVKRRVDRKPERQFGKDTNVRSKDEPYIDIETGVLHWCGWEYKRIEPQDRRQMDDKLENVESPRLATYDPEECEQKSTLNADDLISRREAIDALEKGKPLLFINEDGSIDPFGAGQQNQWYRDGIVIMNLPSAEPEIIRCKDCKNSEHWYRDKLRCFLWHKTGIDVFEDGYCNYAERRTYG